MSAYSQSKPTNPVSLKQSRKLSYHKPFVDSADKGDPFSSPLDREERKTFVSETKQRRDSDTQLTVNIPQAGAESTESQLNLVQVKPSQFNF